MAWPPITHQDVQDALQIVRNIVARLKDDVYFPLLAGDSNNPPSDDAGEIGAFALTAGLDFYGPKVAPQPPVLPPEPTSWSFEFDNGSNAFFYASYGSFAAGTVLTAPTATGSYLSLETAEVVFDPSATDQYEAGGTKYALTFTMTGNAEVRAYIRVLSGETPDPTLIPSRASIADRDPNPVPAVEAWPYVKTLATQEAVDDIYPLVGVALNGNLRVGMGPPSGYLPYGNDGLLYLDASAPALYGPYNQNAETPWPLLWNLATT